MLVNRLNCIAIKYTYNKTMSKTAPINMRAEPSQHALLTKAAAVLNQDRSSFILDVACREAENVLLDQRVFCWDEAQFEGFLKELSAPYQLNLKLQKLLSESDPWDE